MFWLITHVMYYSIDLEADLGGGAVEIEHVVIDRVLAAEMYAIRALAQQIPNHFFWKSHVATELPCSCDVFRLF